MIKIVCVGKIKEKFYKAIEEYKKRLSKYTKLTIIEVPDFASDNAMIEMEKEKEKILKYIDEKDYVITLEIEGKQMDSVAFSKEIEKISIIKPNITFVIGGSCGLHPDIKSKSDLKLSFSKMTFPHQLFRIVLLEQIYRAYKIKNNESYHK